MQKKRRNIYIKWMLQDLVHEIAGCSNVGWQRAHMRKLIDHHNRDRAGGHRHTDLKIKSVENIFTDEVGTARRKSIKKVNRKAQRINQKAAAREALADYEWCNELTIVLGYDTLQEQFEEEDRERQRQLLSEYNGSYYMEDYEDDMSHQFDMDFDEEFYDGILEDAYWDHSDPVDILNGIKSFEEDAAWYNKRNPIPWRK